MHRRIACAVLQRLHALKPAWLGDTAAVTVPEPGGPASGDHPFSGVDMLDWQGGEGAGCCRSLPLCRGQVMGFGSFMQSGPQNKLSPLGSHVGSKDTCSYCVCHRLTQWRRPGKPPGCLSFCNTR